MSISRTGGSWPSAASPARGNRRWCSTPFTPRRGGVSSRRSIHPGRGPLRPGCAAPRVARIDGLAPALATDHARSGGSNPRSTAATAAGIHDYVRALYAKVGKPHCLGCGSPVHSHRFEELLETASALPAGTRLVVLAPLPFRLRQGEEDPLQAVETTGYTRLRLRGETPPLEEVDPQVLAGGDRIGGSGRHRRRQDGRQA